MLQAGLVARLAGFGLEFCEDIEVVEVGVGVVLWLQAGPGARLAKVVVVLVGDLVVDGLLVQVLVVRVIYVVV